MAKSIELRERSVPTWAIAAAAVVALLVLGYFGWRTFAGHDGDDAGPPKAVRPGMYNIREEAAKHSAQDQSGANTNGR